jgi:hypothetical protein
VRHFTSYGPVDPKLHYAAERRELVEQCVAGLVGEPDEPGHFFTLWAPRQTGKTWLMRRAIEEVRARYGDRFTVGALSMEGVVLKDEDPEGFLRYVPDLLRDGFGIRAEAPASFRDWSRIFHREDGLFDRPVLLLIDELDNLPRPVLDLLVALFRSMFLNREAYLLHGLALIGVRAVLGAASGRGSPFNVQRSLHVPNLTRGEVIEMFAHYQAESGQEVLPEVVDAIFATTRGQPGLVGWFGELLTQKYNPDPGAPIGQTQWERAYMLACRVEPNNTVLNLVTKARGPHVDRVMALFGRPDVPFSFDDEAGNFLYLNGIIDYQETTDERGLPTPVCRFSSPFIQLRLYNALTRDLFEDSLPAPAIEPLDALDDVFLHDALDLGALLQRYKGFLGRLAAKGQDPWKEQPLRRDLRLREAAGHFHLYAWLTEAVRGRCAVMPEFPTGNGKVDLLVRGEGREGVIEVKSFRAMHELPRAREQAARYAKGRGLGAAAVALFVATEDKAVLAALSGEEVVEGVNVAVVAIGWG